MKKIIIIGCGGHANSCIEIIENSKEFKIYGLVCDKKKENLINIKFWVAINL